MKSLHLAISVISFYASVDFCRLLIAFANSLDPDQDRQNVGPELDPNRLTLWLWSESIFWRKKERKEPADDNTERLEIYLA